MNHYGNPAVKVTGDDVQVIRQGGPQSKLLLLARIGMIAGVVLALALLVWLLKRKKRPVRINENDWK